MGDTGFSSFNTSEEKTNRILREIEESNPLCDGPSWTRIADEDKAAAAAAHLAGPATGQQRSPPSRHQQTVPKPTQ
jgi:hypothetical protein